MEDQPPCFKKTHFYKTPHSIQLSMLDFRLEANYHRKVLASRPHRSQNEVLAYRPRRDPCSKAEEDDRSISWSSLSRLEKAMERSSQSSINEALESEETRRTSDEPEDPVVRGLYAIFWLLKSSKEVVLSVIRELLNDIFIFSDIMITSKGRDKVFSLVQYIFDLYIKCMSHSQEYGHLVKRSLIKSVRVAKIMKSNISSGRKMFKFLKFIDEYKQVEIQIAKLADTFEEKKKVKHGDQDEVGQEKAPKKQPGISSKNLDRSVKILSIITKSCGMFYYFFDNMVWIANMGAIPKEIIENRVNWRTIKDTYSLIKNFCYTVKSLIKLQLSFRKQREIENKLYRHLEGGQNQDDIGPDQREVKISSNDKISELALKLIEQRSKRRNCQLGTFTAVLRIIQLFYRLKFKFARNHFHPIFVVVCRLVSICLSLFKIWCNSTNLISKMSAQKVGDINQLKKIQTNYCNNNKPISLKEVRKLRLFFQMAQQQSSNLHQLLAIERKQRELRKFSNPNLLALGKPSQETLAIAKPSQETLPLSEREIEHEKTKIRKQFQSFQVLQNELFKEHNIDLFKLSEKEQEMLSEELFADQQ